MTHELREEHDKRMGWMPNWGRTLQAAADAGVSVLIERPLRDGEAFHLGLWWTIELAEVLDHQEVDPDWAEIGYGAISQGVASGHDVLIEIARFIAEGRPNVSPPSRTVIEDGRTEGTEPS